MSTEIKLSYKEAELILPSLKKIAVDDKMPAFLNWRFVSAFDLIIAELKKLEAQRIKLILKYCDKDMDGKPVQLQTNSYKVSKPEDLAAYNVELEDLLNETFTISIKISKLSELAPYNLSLINLSKFIVDDIE